MKDKPKHNIRKSVSFMAGIAWKTRKSVLIFCIGAAIAQVGIHLLQLFIAPEIIAKVEQEAPLLSLIWTIVFFTLGIFVLRFLINCMETFSPHGRCEVRSSIREIIIEKVCLTSYPNVSNPDLLNMQKSALAATNSSMGATEQIWPRIAKLITALGLVVVHLVLLITAFSNGISQMLTHIGKLQSNTRFIRTAYEFLNIPNSMYQGSLPTEKRMDREYVVEFKDVSFKYPGSNLWALRHVNMKFKVGQRLAIVGENGSGKTTFIKLLCRLYDPLEGQILLNGIDIRKYNYRDYMDVFSIVFQDFQLLSQPLGANVAGSSEYDAERVTQALSDAGFGDRLAELPEGLDTMLYKDFGENGVEVSGGEAQKIAIARALYKDAPFIILDEPTASLDPIAEAEIYAKFNDISGDKTAIYISHRLSSCKFCDEIAVFHEGAVIQQGTHAELVADEAGKYHELWNAQAQYYTEKTE